MTPTETIIDSSEDAKSISASPVFSIIDPDNNGLTVGAFGVHFLLKDTNFILIYDRFQADEFCWYEARARVTPDQCLFGLMDYGMREVSFEYVFNSVPIYQQEHLLYMLHIFGDKYE